MKWSYLQPRRMISADWSNYIWKVTGVFFPVWFFFFFLCVCLCSSLVFLLWRVSARSKWSLSSDMTCQSRQGNAHSRWHYFGVCTRCATTPFISCELKFTTYPLTEGVNSSNMTQALILLGKQKKTCLSLSTFLDKENNKQSCLLFSLYILLNKSENLKNGLKI